MDIIELLQQIQNYAVFVVDTDYYYEDEHYGRDYPDIPFGPIVPATSNPIEVLANIEVLRALYRTIDRDPVLRECIEENGDVRSTAQHLIDTQIVWFEGLHHVTPSTLYNREC